MADQIAGFPFAMSCFGLQLRRLLQMARGDDDLDGIKAMGVVQVDENSVDDAVWADEVGGRHGRFKAFVVVIL
ncbi:MAG: hypothetical protein HOC74_19345 [Gemmatimonadetes bacterium]|nr:hypothetical protein [Gemmatimonadota bacterium]